MFVRGRPPVRSTAILTGLLLASLLPGGVLAAAPVAVDDAFTVGVGAPPTALDVLGNDSDSDGDPLRVVDVTEPTNGTAAPSVDGSAVSYQPDAAFRGVETIEYTIEDGSTGTSSGTVTVTVNDPPIAVDDPGTVCQALDLDGQPAFGGTYLVIEDHVGPVEPTDYRLSLCGMLVNDTDPNGDALTWEILTQPSHGDAIKLDESIFGYRPDPDFNTEPGDQPGGQWFSDSFTYRAFDGLSYSDPATVGFWVAPINDPPTFTPGEDVWVVQDSGAYSATWATDISPGPANESDQTVHFELTSMIQFQPENLFAASPAIDGDGVLTFLLASDVNGSARVRFRARDDGGTEPNYAQGTDSPPPDDTADDVTFNIFVTSQAIDAVDDDVQLPEDPASYPWPYPPYNLPNPWPVDVMANDTFPPGVTITAVTQGTIGDVTIAPDGLSVLYAPNADANGTDTFTYTLDDGAGSTETATVHVVIDPVNDPPVAVDDSLTVSRNAPATALDVLGNDEDVDSASAAITGATDGSKGTVVVTGGGTGLTYQPTVDQTGADSFTYTVSDGDGGTDMGTVDVTINATNSAPIAPNDAGLTVPESAGPTALAVRANDTDPDGDPMTITGKTNGAHGTVAITGGGTGLTYDPVQLYYGTDVFSYTVSDGHGGIDSATVLVTVVKDTVKPIVTAPTERFYLQTAAPGTMKVRLDWSGSDPGGTGIARYKLQVSVNGGSYSTVALASAGSTTIKRTLTDGRTYRFRVRATDWQGNVSPYVYGPTIRPGRYQNTSASLTFTGSWTTATPSSALGGSHRYASSLSARVSITKKVRDIAWVATKTATSGSAQVWIDGVLAATINTRVSSTQYRKLVFQRSFPTLGTHTIEIRPIGGGRVYLDAFFVLR